MAIKPLLLSLLAGNLAIVRGAPSEHWYPSHHHGGPRHGYGHGGYGKPGGRSGTGCKVFPGDSNWPSTDSWNQLNSTVGGRLSAVVPLPSVCHQATQGLGVSTYDASQCEALKTAWLDDQTL